jgi:energy-coupling factor transporter ATP-binding protein EcfA2
MIERAYIHVTGPEGSGKTTLIEAILGAFDGPAVTVRCRRDDDLDESAPAPAPARDAELRRYRETGASGVARFAFPAEAEDGDGFFCSKVMSNYSKAVLIEGDCPVEYVDLEVFVAPPLPAGSSLLRRTKRRTPAVAASALEEILLGVGGHPAIAAFAGSRAREAIGKAAAIYGDSFAAKGHAHGHWELAPTHQGLERVGLVVVNVRARGDRAAAERMLDEIARIRSDDDVRAAVLGRFAHRTKVTAVVADLSDPKDAGTKKALARIKRALAARPTVTPKKKAAKKSTNRISKARLAEMIEEATVDAYGDSEQATGWFTMFEENLALPFDTEVLGVPVRVKRIEQRDDDRLVAICVRGRDEQAIGLVDMPLPTPLPPGAEWIEAYRLWRGGR